MSSGRNKDELNLVPFIDLFSVLICFLIMTAVWNQIEALSTVVTSNSPAELVLLNQKKETLTVTLLIDRMELAESVSNGSKTISEKNYKIANLGVELDLEKLKEVLISWKAKYPEKKDIIINIDNEIIYKKLIQTFDSLVASGFPDVGINTQ